MLRSLITLLLLFILLSILSAQEIVSNEKLGFPFLKRAKFRRGLKKSIKIGNWFSQKFSNRNKKWVIDRFKASFSLSYKGIFRLVGTTGSSTLTLQYDKITQ